MHRLRSFAALAILCLSTSLFLFTFTLRATPPLNEEEEEAAEQAEVISEAVTARDTTQAQPTPPLAEQEDASAKQKQKPAGQAKQESKQQAPPNTQAEESAQEKKQKPGEKKAAENKAKEAPKGTEPPKDPLFNSATYSGLRLRNIGPAVTSGRVEAFAVNPNNRAQYWVASASGGVWKTVNAGTTFTSVFDNEGSYSIGAITLDPNNTNVVWVGTGENNAQRSVSYGDGVYKTEDGGKSWKNLGLKKSEHIGRILIDPRDSKVVYVAAQGPLWGPGGDRGLYKTTDGGKTWKAVLTISENTGVSDIAFDPENPDTIYASAWQRRRHVFTMIDGGPESALYRSTDAGATWNKVNIGVPQDIGRIGIATTPADPNVVYLQVEAANNAGGIFRSDDKGVTFAKRNPYDSTGMYYSRIVADPKNVDRVYIMGVFVQVSEDGGKTFHRLGERSKHVDSHDIWIDPHDTNYLIVGCDGGVYDTYDRGANWGFKSNLPVTQFYDVAVDNSQPFYYVFGGTQDNFSLGGPSQTKNISGITNADWFVTTGGDGFRSQVDPEDPNTIYAESQYGGLVRYDRRTGEEIGIQPSPGKGEAPLRWNWDSPIIISPHSHTRLYFAANKLFRSDDRGNSWNAVSPDLTRQIDRNKLPVMGKIWPADAVAKNASTSFYGNIVALAESPKKDGQLYVGTDDGLIQITSDGGANWSKVDKFAGVPDNTYVSRLAASTHDPNTVYAAFDNHKNSDFKPYLLKSADGGKTWTSIANNLPENGPVLAIAEDTVNPNLIFVGTEYGLWFSMNSGAKWTQLKGNFPTIAVRDIVIHPKAGDLVLASFGRGFWVLDDLTPLRALKNDTLAQGTVNFPVKDTFMYIQSRPLGGRAKSFQGEQFYIADNPPYGATLTYYLKDKLKTKKEQRQDAEKDAYKKNQVPPYPTGDALRAEAEEQPPVMYYTVYDPNGAPIRNINAPVTEGFHRVTWDLHYPAPQLAREVSEGDEDLFFGAAPGPLVVPGEYTARLFKKQDGKVTEIAQAQKFKVYVDGTTSIKPEDRAALAKFQQDAAKLFRSVSGSVNTANDLKTRMKAIRRALQDTPSAQAQLAAEAERIDGELNVLLRSLRGDVILAARNENVPPSIQDRARGALENSRFSITAPPKTDQEDWAIAESEYRDVIVRLRKLAETDIPNLQKQMQAAGAPWTPGTVPEWQQ
jgi:photosystem II stability/assembly factor-like uncharacterized protein